MTATADRGDDGTRGCPQRKARRTPACATRVRGASSPRQSTKNPRRKAGGSLENPREARRRAVRIGDRVGHRSERPQNYYGWYSNKMRGQRRKREEEEAARESAATAEQGRGAVASAAIEIIEHLALKPRRIPSRSWRELIKKVWEVDPLLCPYDIPASSRDAPRVTHQ